ncbi:hypothetical protein M3M33_05335 [Loigolactobacillus coryniformis]|uniref:hypothetical protein n=1 Tax=Loigolactobacillus coryniformis TaxID=1610 RepID=UPI00201A334E|nr:hypothetical protein [Loigolactobacillus coryniformis]MCL5458096.1 hypothetical protein [Loigolactobacillus coryniformis]
MLFKKQVVHDAWAATERTLDFKVTVKGKNYTATDISSLSYDSGAMNGEALTLGSTYTNTIKITFSHLIEGLALLDEITPQIGIQLPDGTWDFTSLGVFIIDSEVQQDRNNNTTTLSASDRMCMMGGTYESKLSYPAEINDVAVEIANMAGMKVNVDDFARLPTEKILSLGKVTYRDAIGYVAQFAGGFATFDRDGLLDIRVLSDPNFTVTPDQYQSKGLTKNEAFYRIGGLTCSVTTTVKDDSGSETQETTTLQSGSTAGTQIILNNPGMTQVLLDGLYEQLQDLNFYPFSLNWFGDPSLEAGDWITVQDTAGNEFKTPNLLYSLTFGGGVTATSKADTTITASANFVYRGATNQIITNIRRYLNAAGHAISEGIDEPTSPKAGDIWFKKEGPDTTIMTYVIDPETGVGSWHEGPSTKANAELQKLFEDLKEEMKSTSAAASAAAIAGSAAMVAGNQASAAGSAAQSAADSVAAKVVESSKEVAAAKSAASSAVDQASQAVAAAFDNTQQISTLKTDMADATTQASAAYASANTAFSTANTALDTAKTAIDSATTAATDASGALSTANTALTNANQAVTTTKTLSTKVDDITDTITTLATTETVNKLTGTVTTVQTLAQQNAAGLLTKADTKIVDTLNKTVSDHSAQLKLTATGAQFDAVSKVVDGVKNTVTTNTANIAANTQALTLAAKQTTVDALSKTVDNQTAQLKLTATEAELKTAQTSINTLDGRVTSINGQLNVQAGLIAAKVTASDVTGMLGNYATQSWSQGQISAAKNEISASVETVKQRVDNLNGGGRNYFLDSKTRTITPPGTANYDWRIYISDGFWSNSDRLKSNNIKISFTLSAQKALTAAFNSRLHFGASPWPAKAISYPAGTTAPQKYELVFNITDSAFKADSCFIRFQAKDTSDFPFVLENANLGIGTTFTDWTPAPEDMAAQSWTKSLLDVSEGKVSAQVQSVKTDLTNATNTLNNNIANATTGMATQTWTQGKLDLTADGLTSQISSVQDGLNTKYTSLEQTLKGVQITANNAVTQSQYTQLANQFTSTIAAVASGNLVADSGWTGVTIRNHSFYTGTHTLYGLGNATTHENYARSPRFSLKPNTKYTLSIIGFANSNVVSADVFVLTRPKGSTTDYEHAYNLLPNKRFSPHAAERATSSFTTLNDGEAYIRIDNNGTNNGIDGTVFFTEVQLEEGSIATPYKLSVSAAQSQITQLQSDINLRVKTGDLVSQISVNVKGILLDGASTYITNTTHIDTGVIKSANIQDAAITSAKIGALAVTTANIGYAAVTNAEIAALAVGTAQIADGAITNAKIGNASITTAKIGDAQISSAKIISISADKITVGTLDAAKVNVVNLNASNITTGTISGANLSINLSTGNVLFQKGSIKSTNGNLNIDINSGNMAVTNAIGNGFRFEDGKLFLTTKDWINSFQSKPDYGYIAFQPSFLSNVQGMEIAGTDGIAVTAGNYDAFSFMFQNQPKSGSALALHDNTAFLNAREHTRIEGGSMYTETWPFTNQSRAAIVVGGANGGVNQDRATDQYGKYHMQEPSKVGADIFVKGYNITLQGGHDNSTTDSPQGYQKADLNLGNDGISGFISSTAIYNRTYSSGDHVVITNWGTLGRLTSARKYKVADQVSQAVIDKAKRVLNIQPAEWYDKAEVESIADALTNGTTPMVDAKIEKHYGFIADDFDAAGLTEVVLYKGGEVDSLAYDRIPIYHNVILSDHEKRIAELEAEVKQLKGEI